MVSARAPVRSRPGRAGVGGTAVAEVRRGAGVRKDGSHDRACGGEADRGGCRARWAAGGDHAALRTGERGGGRRGPGVAGPAAGQGHADRQRLTEIHRLSIIELEDGLAPELREELERLSLPFEEGNTPSEAELRIAQAQLVGWLEGLFHGI